MKTALTAERAEDLAPMQLGSDAPTATSPVASGPTIPQWLRAGSAGWVWLGVAVAMVGFGLIVVAWGQVAGETQVHRQLPYVVSAAFVGLGLVMVAVTIVNVATRQRDAIERDRQIAQLATILEELRTVMRTTR